MICLANLLWLRTKVREILQEPIPARWSDNTINEYLNEGQKRVAEFAEIIRMNESSLGIGITTVSTPADCLVLRKIFWGDATEKRELNLAGEVIPLDDNSEGEPNRYYRINEQIEIRPIPNVAKNLYMVYYWKPTEMINDVDTPEIKDAEQAIYSYAVYQAYFEDSDPRAALWEEKYQKSLLEWSRIHNMNYSAPFQTKTVW